MTENAVNDLLIAIDTGGTRTSIEMMTATGGLVRRAESSGVFSGAQSSADYAAALSEILSATEKLLESDNADGRAYAFIGAAGFAESTSSRFLDAIHEVVPSALGGRIAAMGVGNDAISLLLGHDAEGVVIAGTGSNVLVRDRAGRIRQTGGEEWVASDQGSGFWIGLRAIRRAFSDFETGRDSALLEHLYEVYDIEPGDAASMSAAMRGLVAGEGLKSSIARFAAATCTAAERGDTDAQDIVTAEAEDLADRVAGALRRAFSEEELSAEVRVVQCGSLLGDDVYRSVFESQIHRRLASTIHWKRVETGTEAQLALARRLQESGDDWTTLPAQFRPVVVRFD